MSSLPLTRAGDWTEIGMEPLFADLAPNGARPVEMTVTVPHGDGRRPVMDIITREDQAVEDFAMAFSHARDAEGFEIVVRRYAGLSGIGNPAGDR